MEMLLQTCVCHPHPKVSGSKSVPGIMIRISQTPPPGTLETGSLTVPSTFLQIFAFDGLYVEWSRIFAYSVEQSRS